MIDDCDIHTRGARYLVRDGTVTRLSEEPVTTLGGHPLPDFILNAEPMRNCSEPQEGTSWWFQLESRSHVRTSVVKQVTWL